MTLNVNFRNLVGLLKENYNIFIFFIFVFIDNILISEDQLQTLYFNKSTLQSQIYMKLLTNLH